jgi:hypothetical protein
LAIIRASDLTVKVFVFQNTAPDNQLIFTLLVGLDVDQPCCVYGNREATPANYGERRRTSADEAC